MNNQPIDFALGELRKYLIRMGIALRSMPSVTLELHTTLPELKKPVDARLDDHYAIDATPEGISICATNPRALLLGAYRLLSELGCRFLGPTAPEEYIPIISAQDINVKLSAAASYRHRGICIEGADSLDNVLQFLDWLPKLGYNSFFVQFKEPTPFLQRWYDHVYNPLLSPEPLSEQDEEWAYRKIDSAIALRGLLHHRVGHGWTSEAIGIYTVCAKSEEPLSEQKASLLAKVNGKRELIGGISSNTNLCYSNPIASENFIHSVVTYATAHRELDYLHVWVADEYNNICECENCATTTLSDQYIEMLDEIDRRLSAAMCDAKIVLLLYQELLWPPIKAKLHNSERFTMMFAPISRTFEKSYAQMGPCGEIPQYQRNKVTLPRNPEENLSFLKEWQSQYDIDSFIYDYPLGRAHYGDLGYYGIAKIISEDIGALRAMHLDGYMSCQELRVGFPNFFPNYVMGKRLWDDTLTFEEVTEEYFSAAYGERKANVLAYLQELSSLSSWDYFNKIGDRLNPELATRWGKVAPTVKAFLAEDKTSGKEQNSVERIFCQRLDYHGKYCIILSKALEALAAGNAADMAENWHSFLRFVREKEMELQPFLDVYRVLEVATKYAGFTLDIPR